MRRLFQLAKRALLTNFGPPPHPYKLTFIVTYKCNLRCSMCNIWARDDSGRELDLGEIEEFFSKSKGFSWVNISGGEIFLRKDITDVARIIIKRCENLFLLDFPTSGFMPDLIVGRTREILGLGPRKLAVTISLDGPEEVHDSIRGVAGAWRKALATFNELKQWRGKRFSVFFGMTLFAKNAPLFKETLEAASGFVKDLKYEDFHINLAHSSEHYYANKGCIEVEKEEAASAIEEFLKLKRFSLDPMAMLERRYQRLALEYLASGKTPLCCKALTSSCFIDPYGDVYPCISWGEKLGSLRDHSYELSPLWAGEIASKLRLAIVRGDCPNCWTPCEAYQTILGNIFRGGLIGRKRD